MYVNYFLKDIKQETYGMLNCLEQAVLGGVATETQVYNRCEKQNILPSVKAIQRWRVLHEVLTEHNRN